MNNHFSIVAIHGLNGHPLDTWTKATKLWLRDFLPGVMPEARILSFGYDSCNAFAAGRSCLRTWVIRLLSAIKQVRSRYNDPKVSFSITLSPRTLLTIIAQDHLRLP